jgi:DNA-binding beta-propeller fold protein YncE
MDRGIRVARIIGAVVLSAIVILVAIVEAKRPGPAAGATMDAGRRFDDVSRYVFVPGRNDRAVAVIEQDTDHVAGTLDLGFIPEQVVVSESTAKLVAIDGTTPRVTIVELASGGRTGIDLAFTPHRLIASTDGYMLAAADLSVGTVAFIELVRGREVSRITGLSSIRDLMFGADAAFLYVAAEDLTGIGVIDVARGKLVEEISVANLRSGDVTGLTRSPSGRTGYVKTRGDAAVSLIDLRNFRPIGRLDAGLDAGKAFPTGTGFG